MLTTKWFSQNWSKSIGKSLLDSLGSVDLRSARTSHEIPANLTRLLRAERVRYTGVEFGQAAIVPTEPREVISRHYGDCKDKATLLVALFVLPVSTPTLRCCVQVNQPT